MLRFLRKAVHLILWGLAVLVIAVVGINYWILSDAGPFMYDSPESVPFNAVGMVLGTSKSTRSGKPNQHFVTRMDAAADLYRAGKVKHLVLSGDNMTPYYDEPNAMKTELMQRGVPEYDITLDSAGFRTFDSVVRLKEVFGVNSCTIISERYHVYRAVFISRHYDLEAVGYAAADVPFYYGLRSRSREMLARVKAVMDLYLLDTKPGD